MPLGLISTFVSSFPMNLCPITFDDFRPIMLLGSLYKEYQRNENKVWVGLSKSFFLRLKVILDSLISLKWLAYIQGWHILNGALITPKILHNAGAVSMNSRLVKIDLT